MPQTSAPPLNVRCFDGRDHHVFVSERVVTRNPNVCHVFLVCTAGCGWHNHLRYPLDGEPAAVASETKEF